MEILWDLRGPTFGSNSLLTGSDTTHYTISVGTLVTPPNHSDIKILGNHLKEIDPV